MPKSSRIILVLFAAAGSFAVPAAAASPYALTYGGRLADAGTGAPVKGPVDLEFKFFDAATAGNQLGAAVDLAAVPLTDGIFSAHLALGGAAFQAIFGAGTSVYVETTDVTHAQTYPRQVFSAVPYALAVPVDGTTIGFNTNGQLAVVAPSSTQPNGLVQLDATSRLPAVDGSQLTGVAAASVGGAQATAVAAGVATVNGATSADAPGALVKRDGAGSFAAATVQVDAALKLKAATSGNLIALRAAAGAAAATYTLPGSPAAGAFLQTDAGGNLSWASPGGGGDMLSSVWTGGGFLARNKGGLGQDVSTANGVPSFTAGALGFLAVGTSAANLVQLNGSGQVPNAEINWAAPGALGGTTPAGGTFTTLSATTVTATGAVAAAGLTSAGAVTTQGNTVNAAPLKLGDKGSVNYVALKAPDTLGGSTTYTLPAAPAANNFLQTDGAGVLSWQPVTVSGATGTLAVANGGTGLSTLPTDGQLLIGKTATNGYAQATLAGTPNRVTVTNGGGTITLSGPQDLHAGASPSFLGLTVSGLTDGVVHSTSGALTGGKVNLASASEVQGTLGVGNGGTGLSAGTLGGVPYFSGAGTIASTGLLAVNGVVLGGGTGSAPTTTAAGNAYQSLRVPSGGGAPAFGAVDLSQGAAVANQLSVTNGGTGAASAAAALGNLGGLAKAGDTMGGTLNLPANGLVAGTSQLVLSGGNVGIGSAAPVGKLDVAGAVHLNGATSGYVGFAVPAAAGSTTYTWPAAPVNGNMLQTDGSGNLTWAASSSQWTSLNGNVYYNSGNVGAGTTNPVAKLDVGGQIHAAVLPSSANTNATSLDWNNGNAQYSVQSNAGSGGKAITFSNMLDGGAYTLAMQNAAGVTYQYNFAQTSPATLTFKYVNGNGPTAAGKDTIYTFVVMGTTVYVSWITNI